MQLGWTGPAFAVSTACASGTYAIGEGLRLLRDGSADVVLAGGTEATLSPATVHAFANLNALSTRNDEPARASRPFDRDRSGFVMGEGAGFCVLEPLDHARERGAVPYALLAGYGRNGDAHHLVMPVADGAGAAACMRACLADAGIAPSEVTHVNAHGTSTKLNDQAEATAIRAVFGDAVPAVTSTKGAIGHLIAAAGAVEFAEACLTMRHAVIAPTANYENADDDIGLDVVASPRALVPGAIVSNSFGFGGHNASVVIIPAT